MFKIWLYLFLVILIILLLIIIINFNSFLIFFIYSELFWMFSFLISIVGGSEFNDPRFIFLGFLVLYIATLEIIFIGLYFSFKIK